MIFHISKKPFRPNSSAFAVLAFGILAGVLACGCARIAHQSDEPCSNYADRQSSPYILPHARGEAHPVIQGNCAPRSISPIGNKPHSPAIEAKLFPDFADLILG